MHHSLGSAAVWCKKLISLSLFKQLNVLNYISLNYMVQICAGQPWPAVSSAVSAYLVVSVSPEPGNLLQFRWLHLTQL